MRKHALALVAALALLVSVTTAVAATTAFSTEARLAYDAVPIGGGSYLGGFSDLYPIGNSGLQYLTLTDRGPNEDISCRPGFTDKTFAVPSFAPEIIRLVAVAGKLVPVQRIQMKVNGVPITGLSARTDRNEKPYGPGGCSDELPYDPNGVDSEGIVIDPRDSSFWIADEYLPSVLHVSKRGEILSRIVPAGLAYSPPGVSVVAAFPAIVGSNFRPNRGFEGIAISPDGKSLYTLLQSAMQNGSSTNNSRAVRVFKLDISRPHAPAVVAEWVHRLDGTQSPSVDRRISALIWAGRDKLLVEERDDVTPATAFTKLFRTDFRNATNILGTAWDSTATSPTLEENFKLTTPTTDANSCDAVGGVNPGCKTAWFDVAGALTASGFTNGKVEGAATVRLGHKTLVAVLNDNDFNVDGTTIDEKLEIIEK
jgi:hypothetical protein